MSLARQARDAAKRLKDADFVHVVSDNDADGIAAAAVVAVAFRRAGIASNIRCSGRPEPDHWRELEQAEHILFMDMGASNLDRIEALPGHAVVLDHHQVEREARTATYVNPNLLGEDGTRSCCASTLAYLFAVGLDDGNEDLGAIALGGIVGDRQHVPEPSGENLRLLKKAIKGDHVAVEHGLPYAADVPLEQELAASTDPYLVSISGRARNARRFLENLGFEAGVTLSDLDEHDRERFASAVVVHQLEHGVLPDVAQEGVRPRWWIKRLANIEAGELAALLNACGRLGQAGVGVAAATGDMAHMEIARTHLHAYNERVLAGLVKLEAAPPVRMKAIQVFDAPDPELAGVHCGLGLAFIFPKDAPCLAIADYGDVVKVSSRGTHPLIKGGVNLAEALRIAAGEAGGAGGGHPIAAGAKIPSDQKEAFLARVDEIIAGQVGA